MGLFPCNIPAISWTPWELDLVASKARERLGTSSRRCPMGSYRACKSHRGYQKSDAWQSSSVLPDCTSLRDCKCGVSWNTEVLSMIIAAISNESFSKFRVLSWFLSHLVQVSSCVLRGEVGELPRSPWKARETPDSAQPPSQPNSRPGED